MKGNVPFESHQLCWECAKASGNMGGCSWSNYGTPVEGWNAIETHLRFSADINTQSYMVIECPEFVRDTYNSGKDGSTLPEIPKPVYTDNGIDNLLDALVYSAGKALYETTEGITEYKEAMCLKTLGAERILRKILEKKGRTWDDIQREGTLVEPRSVREK